MREHPAHTQAWIRELFERYEGPALRYTMRITGNLESARDIVQEAFLRLCTPPLPAVVESADNEYGLAWLFRVCRHRALDQRRKEKRMQTVDHAQLDAYPSEESGPSQQMEQSQSMSHVAHIIQTLPKTQQDIVLLKFQDGMSYKEIAQILDMSVSHVGVALHNAMKAIREKMAQMSMLPTSKGGGHDL